MKTVKKNYVKVIYLFLLTLSFIRCDRELSENAEFATFATTGEIYTDDFIAMGSNFYFPYGPDASNPIGSKPTAWSVDEKQGYKSASSMRIDVPKGTDPQGNFAGAILRVDGAGRDLSSYDALTFWAKSSQTAAIGEIGFGEDFGDNKYQATITNVDLSTNWTKYVIPIPDPSKLVNERGMLRYAAGSIDGMGYTFWIDDLKFEKLGTLGQPQPAILFGQHREEDNFIGNVFDLTAYGLTQTFNLASGINQTITTAPSYFSFESSDIEVVRVGETGIVSIVGVGKATITASIAGVKAAGSLTINTSGAFPVAPVPTANSSDVISIFSDSYTNIPVDFYNGFWEPYQTTLGGESEVDGQNILNYTNFNFVGTQLTTPINITEMTHYSIDLLMLELPADLRELDLLVTLAAVDGTSQQNRFGTNYQVDPQAPIIYPASSFVAEEWKTLKIPIRPTSETSLNKELINIIIIENIKSSQIKTFFMDNMYFYKE
jgi:hypothetical protein